MTPNRPRGRQKNISGQGKDIYRRNSGLGSGPVGSRPEGRPGPSAPQSFGRRNVTRSGGGFSKLIILLLVLLFGGGGGLGSMLLGSGDMSDIPSSSYHPPVQQQIPGSLPSASIDLTSLLGNLGGGAVSSGWDSSANTGKLDTSVAPAAREKYTKLLGNGQDKMTIMLYLCGTDLESRSKMATADLQEMLNADLSDDVNLIVYSGGCKQWQNNVLSSKTNQIWEVKDEGLVPLEKDLGSKSMTDPKTLSSFIQYCAKKYPANRNALIFWDHGGGSVSGYGYDEKFASSGSMSLAEIDTALTDGGVKFDWVGFDACLMATTENALMLSKHADYMIASEETEPGIGWYYTDWLTELSENPSLSTLEMGKIIVDDFIDTCAQKCPGQSTTLSVVDLAEAEKTIPDVLGAFSIDTYELIKNKEFAQVSNARSGSREFGASSKIDQVDLVHLANNMGSEEGKALSEALLSAVKYNRTSSNMTNSYGLSIYFPLRKASMVDDAVDTYELIGMDEDYVRCIEAFASMEAGGQAVSGGTPSPLPSLMEMMGSSGANGNAEMVAQLLGAFLQSSSGMDFLSGRAMPEEDMVSYFSEHSFDGSQLQWQDTASGSAIVLPEEQWELVQSLHANMFFDDGEGYIDLGCDNVYDFDEQGNLLAPSEMTWIAVNEQPVAYYHESTVDDGEDYSITGRIPVLYNSERAELVVEFTDELPYGTVVGVRRVYKDGETDTVAKTMDTVKDGDIIDFVCDYYSYDGEYLDSYMLGEQLTVDGELTISDVYVDESAANLTYLFTDIYNQQYWSAPVK